MDYIYLDNSATTKPSENAVKAANSAMGEFFANPSSTHALGVKTAEKLANARKTVATALNVPADSLYFTSGGTSADNLAILGSANVHSGRHAVTTGVEHPAVLNCFKELERRGFEVTYIPTDKNGNIALESIEIALREDTSFVSIMHVNNETGAIMPIEQVRGLIDRECPGAVFHTDAVQSFGKCDIFPEKWGIDLVSVSAHKIHGLKGAGALYVRRGVNIKPTVFGGGQEKNLYSGTENMPSIMAFAAACSEIADSDREKVSLLSKTLKKGILEIEGTHIHSPADALPYIINVSFGKVPSEVVLNALSAEGIMISAGSACASSKVGKSHVLASMGADTAKSAVRFSLSKQNTLEDIQNTIKVLNKTLPMLIKAIGGRR